MTTDLAIKPIKKLPISKAAAMVIDLVSMDAICEWAMSGKTQRDIAEMIGVSQGELAAWLSNHPDHGIYRAALEASAEALMDRGDDLMEQASQDPDITNAHVALVKARADFLKSRASMRSKYHRERQPIDDTGGPIIAPTFIIQGVGGTSPIPTVTIEGVSL
jgi:transcriptional regulator with XRE-family HTH domain